MFGLLIQSQSQDVYVIIYRHCETQDFRSSNQSQGVVGGDARFGMIFPPICIKGYHSRDDMKRLFLRTISNWIYSEHITQFMVLLSPVLAASAAQMQRLLSPEALLLVIISSCRHFLYSYLLHFLLPNIEFTKVHTSVDVISGFSLKFFYLLLACLC